MDAVRYGVRRLRVALTIVALLNLAGVTSSATVVGHVTPAVAGRPHYRVAGKPNAKGSQVLFDCQLPKADVTCYGPDQIRVAYDVQGLLQSGTDGRGRTIVIIDAFQSPTLRDDLATFDQAFGLPDPTLNIIAPQGLTPFDPNNEDQVGWSAEISLDVEWAHAIAPGATIDLVLAKSDNDPDILRATRFAVSHNLGDVISMSFGEAEQCVTHSVETDTARAFRRATRNGTTLFASSGDDGAAQPTCDGSGLLLAASSPANHPLVTGVGGTHLDANLQTGRYGSEKAWNDDFGASGGGFSTVYDTPEYQRPLDLRSRGVPDVAYNGDVRGGVLVAWSVTDGPGAFFVFGGTSAGAPQWAGLVAIADQLGGHRLGSINPTLYALGRQDSNLHDITKGNNRVPGIGGFRAGRGWDPVTGLGSPRASHLLPLLASDNKR